MVFFKFKNQLFLEKYKDLLTICLYEINIKNQLLKIFENPSLVYPNIIKNYNIDLESRISLLFDRYDEFYYYNNVYYSKFSFNTFNNLSFKNHMNYKNESIKDVYLKNTNIKKVYFPNNKNNFRNVEFRIDKLLSFFNFKSKQRIFKLLDLIFFFENCKLKFDLIFNNLLKVVIDFIKINKIAILNPNCLKKKINIQVKIENIENKKSLVNSVVIPCISCPILNQCDNQTIVNPHDCMYIKTWSNKIM
ncbi:hypothetical protein (nucleomorph) [Guillardia theta]|uniref:Uncharacterized protein n=1 Tax=Guillardia theta TaxID=55529 RepID=Q98SD7_GUITH|nr:hypothetical protein GTHECHR3003 [Guillardia theta]AAK39647.1 hypothetical protein [Guillardia theta]